jgi:hypothetical protein
VVLTGIDKDDKQHVFPVYNWMLWNALHSCAAGDLVLCKVRDTSTTIAFLSWLCYCYYVRGMYCQCGSTPYLKCTKGLTLSEVRTGEWWLQWLMFCNRRVWHIVGWKCYIYMYSNMWTCNTFSSYILLDVQFWLIFCCHDRRMITVKCTKVTAIYKRLWHKMY